MVLRNPLNPLNPSSSSSSSLSSLSPSPSPSSKIENPSSRRKRAKIAHVTANETEQEENTIEKGETTKQLLLPAHDKPHQQHPTRSGRKIKNNSANPCARAGKENPEVTGSVSKPNKDNSDRKRKAAAFSSGKKFEEGINNKNKLTAGPKESEKEISGECCEEDKGEEDNDAENAEHAENNSSKNLKKRKRKTKEEKEEQDMPLAARSAGRFFVGAHVSAAKGVHNAVTNCLHIGGNAFALFLKSQRKWENPPLQDEHRVQFKNFCAEHKYDSKSHILPHGSYLVNLAHEDPVKAKQSYDSFLDDLHRCEALGIGLYNFHPGAANSSDRPSAIARIAAHLNASHAATSTITTVLETMAGSGTSIGSTFHDLASIIALVNDKSRIGICLDTCHIFAAGHDLRSRSSFNHTLAKFESEIGLPYLKAVHLNDSKAPLGSRVDRHANIGTGFLGLSAFWNIMNDERFEGLPMVLETPAEDEAGKEDKGIYAREIKLLESLVGMERGGEEFGELERELARRGEGERKVAMEKFERKEGKAAKEKAKGKGKDKDKKDQRLDQWVSRKTK